MKEYLLKTEDGKWIHSNTGESFSYVEKIEIPDGAEIAVEFNEDNSGVAFYRKNGKEYANKSTGFGWFGGSKWTLQELLDENFKVDGMDLSHKIIWQREPKYKEFLNKNDNYNLVMLPEHAGDDERSGLIEVPDGAEQLTKLGLELIFWKDNGNFSWHTENSTEWDDNIKHQLTTLNMYGMQHIVWQRYTQPESLPFVDDEVQSINDQYAEIEQVRQDLKDNVNHPSHYTQGKVECIDALESATIGKSGIEAVCVANVIKYLWRYEEKNGIEDVKKAQFYLNRLLATLENNNG